jgi:hypothetical protein
MRHTKPLFRTLLLVALLAPSLLGAEDLPAPSQFRAAIRGETILLSWKDASASRYAVYRSLALIDASSFAQATRLGEVEAGVEAFVDRPPAGQPFYYLVLGLDDKGLAYPVFTPKQNLTLAPVSVEEGPSKSLLIKAAEAPVQRLAASVRSDSVLLSYKPKKTGMRLVLYRGSSAFSDAASLLDAVLVTSFDDKDGSFVDYPVPGLDYWYALLDEAELKTGSVVLKAGENTTVEPIHIAQGRASLASTPFVSRVPPLPSLYFDDKILADSSPIEAGQRLPQKKDLDPETMKAVSVLLEGSREQSLEQPSTRVLREELQAMTGASPTLGSGASEASSGGEGYALTLIVRDRLGKGEWAKAAEELASYLSLNRSQGASARAHFYRGEALAKDGAYREALFEFLETREAYPVETRPWIDYLLAVLARQR